MSNISYSFLPSLLNAIFKALTLKFNYKKDSSSSWIKHLLKLMTVNCRVPPGGLGGWNYIFFSKNWIVEIWRIGQWADQLILSTGALLAETFVPAIPWGAFPEHGPARIGRPAVAVFRAQHLRIDQFHAGRFAQSDDQIRPSPDNGDA